MDQGLPIYIYICIYIQKKDRKLLMTWDWYNWIVMEYQKMINFLNNTPNEPSKFRTKNCVEINLSLSD